MVARTVPIVLLPAAGVRHLAGLLRPRGAALGVAKADPGGRAVALYGDYDLQFMTEELAVGAQHGIPYVRVPVDNAHLGPVRQAQRAFDIDFQAKGESENTDSPEPGVYGVGHVRVAEGLGRRAAPRRRSGR
ncbi:hypothetical protein HTV45_15105 [Streptomyces sp. CHD11]|nr:hypothetical protein [Streptomyces sp. CHD11]